MVLVPIDLPAFAQSSVRSDRTTGTIVTDSGTAFKITEGTTRNSDSGTTLFHSFEHFSPATREVIFDLQDSQNLIDTHTVTAIISRVTGGTGSFIDGQLTILQDGQTPAPDLFLINPNGILFGKNAQLSLPGSFLASTAESILFSDDSTFSTANSSTPSLLTISTPVGLQFGDNTGSIRLKGDGHAIATANPSFAPYLAVGMSSGLSVSPGKSLSLVGGSIDLEGSALSAPSGNIKLGGVQKGTVSLRDRILDYSDVEQFGDIALTERSLADVSGVSPFQGAISDAGSIHLQGQNILIDDGSLVWSQNRGLGPAGQISAIAVEQIRLTGAFPLVDVVSGIVAETVAPGSAGQIGVQANQLTAEAGATLSSRSFSAGNSGRIDIQSERTTISGHTPIAPDVFSVVGTTAFLSGHSGEVTASTQDLKVRLMHSLAQVKAAISHSTFKRVSS